jgi:hypothetical protein
VLTDIMAGIGLTVVIGAVLYGVYRVVDFIVWIFKNPPTW